jgi:tetratricopeptide (TPR) repeat protein
VRDFKRVDELVASGELAQAIARLRDMVDFDPKNLALREKLLHVLRLGYPAAAAELASQLADSNPDKPTFRLHAVQSYLEAGKVQDATRELEIAKLQMPDDAQVVKLTGQLAMERGAWEEAKAAFDMALENGHDPKIKRLRGLAKAMMGDAAGARQDLQADQPVGIEAESFYQKAVHFADLAFKAQSDIIRSLIQKFKITDGSADSSLAIDANRRCLALLELMKRLEAPSLHENSHRHRVLACSLLVQSTQELVLLAQQRSDDHAAEASLSLGEAIKTWTKALEAAAKESRPKG